MTVIAGQDDWGKLRVTGADRVRFLQGMVTNDVAKLQAGAWLRAAILSVKGRVLAVVDVIAEPESFLVLTEAVTGDKVKTIFERHAIADDVAFDPVTTPLHRVWESPAAVWGAPPVLSAATPSDAGAIELRRIEGGLVRYGVDVSEDHFPFEAHLDAAISHTKGCYAGQEVVARATARGHANKRLMGVRLDAPRAAGDKLGDKATITSAAVSPDFGPIALAYVHKTAWEPGTKLDGGTVVALPFGA